MALNISAIIHFDPNYMTTIWLNNHHKSSRNYKSTEMFNNLKLPRIPLKVLED